MANLTPIGSSARVEDEVVVAARTERQAFGRLFDVFYPEVLRYARRRMFVQAAAEDVTSDVFLQIARGLPTFGGATLEEFRRWTFRIATNAINARLRQTLRRRDLLEQAARDGAVRGAALATDETSGEPCDWTEVDAALQELSEREQSLISLRFFAGLEPSQVAEILEMTPAAVRTAQCRALDKLRDLLRRRGVSLTPDDVSSGGK